MATAPTIGTRPRATRTTTFPGLGGRRREGGRWNMARFSFHGGRRRVGDAEAVRHRHGEGGAEGVGAGRDDDGIGRRGAAPAAAWGGETWAFSSEARRRE